MKNDEMRIPMFVVILYTITTVVSLVLTNKIIDLNGYLISACLVVFPLIFFLGDIVAEIYGYYAAQRLIFYSLLGAAVFSMVITLVLYIPTPSFYNNNGAYQEVFGMSLKFILVGFVAIWIGSIVNAYAIARWKNLVNGKYFWFRSIGSSVIGELVNSLVAFPLGFGGVLTVKQVVNLMLISYFVKITYAVLLAPIGGFIVGYIKTVKGIDYTEDSLSFNPFKAYHNESCKVEVV